MKVVINTSHGGFAITKEMAKFMAARGNPRAAGELEREGERFFGFGYVTGMSGGYDRTDPDLIAAVEELGAGTDLKVVEIPDGIEWELEEYDGLEWIAEKHRTWS